ETRRGEFRGVALAASGGPLVRRIRRLVRPTSAEHSIPGPVAAAVMGMLGLVGMGTVGAHGAQTKQAGVAGLPTAPPQEAPEQAPVQVAVNGGIRVPNLLLAPFGPQAPRAAAPVQQPSKAALSGVVVEDSSGSPAVSVAVSVYREGSTTEAAEFET